MFRLPTRQVDEFFRLGYTVVRDVFAPAELDEMRAAFARLEDAARRLAKTAEHHGSLFVLGREPAGARSVVIHRVVWCGAAEPALSRFGRDPRLVDLAAGLLGTGAMSQLINQAHFKLPGDGVSFPWHQDSTHRRFGGREWTDVNGRGSYVQTVTAVDEMTEENGPLRIIPGSSRLGHLDLPGDGTLPAGVVDPASAVTLTLPAGSVLAFGPYTIHSSEPNRSGRPRRAFVNGYACLGANRRVYPGRGAGRLVRATGGAAESRRRAS